MSRKVLKVGIALIAVLTVFVICLGIQLISNTETNKQTVNVRVGNQAVSPNNEDKAFEVERNETITITTSNEKVTHLAYKISNGNIQSTVEGNMTTITLAENFENGVFTLQVSTMCNKKWGKIQVYYLNMVDSKVVLRINGKEVAENSKEDIYEVFAGQEMEIVAIPSTSVSKIAYKFGHRDLIMKEGWKGVISIPQKDEINPKGFDLQISAYNTTTNEWMTIKVFYFKIIN